MVKENKHIGSSLDDLLGETGDLAETKALAIKRVIAWQLAEKMKEEHITKTRMAEMMNTSRSALDRLLDPANTAVTLKTLTGAANALSKRLQIELS